MIEASQRMLKMNSLGGEGINLLIKKHLELEISTLENAPRDAEKLRQLLKVKQEQKEEAMHTKDTERLVTEEIEMLKVVMYWQQVGEGRIRSVCKASVLTFQLADTEGLSNLLT